MKIRTIFISEMKTTFFHTATFLASVGKFFNDNVKIYFFWQLLLCRDSMSRFLNRKVLC